MGPRAGTRVPPCSTSAGELLLDPAFCFMQTSSSRDQEEAVSDVIEAVVRGALKLIQGHQLDGLCYDNSSKIVTNDTLRLYSTTFIGYDPGDPGANVDLSTTTNRANDNGPDGLASVADVASPLTGILFPGPEPQPVMIDRWARGRVVSKSASTGTSSRGYHERSGTSDDWSSIGSRSLRSTKSAPSSYRNRNRGRLLYRSSRKRVRRSEEKQAVSFSLGPDPREDQGLPPTVPPSRDARGVRAAGNGGGFTNGFGTVPGSRRGGNDDEGFEAWLEELGGREWTVDGAGELLVVDRPGPGKENTPKRVVNALYNFRDVTGPAQDIEVPVPSENASSLGGDKGSDRRRNRIGSSLLLSAKGGSLSSSASCRASTRRSSRQRLSKGAERFFSLEPTLQPNLTNSVGRPGPGVSVCDGSSSRKGPSWPQDSNHMSRDEYRQRQRIGDYGAVAHSVGVEGDAEEYSLGFSTGTVQSAPALVVGGLDNELDGGGGGGGTTRASRTRNQGRAGTAEPKQVHRGNSFTTFDDVNPFKGAMRMPPASASPSRREAIGDERGGCGGVKGDLSPLSTPVCQDESFGEGPESVGGQENVEADVHNFYAINSSGYGHVEQGSPKQAGELPEVKQKSRERPLTHERQHIHSPRDPRRVPARKQPHVSPKIKTTSTCSSYRSRTEGGGDGASSMKGTSLSFPPLPSSLSGYGVPGGGRCRGVDRGTGSPPGERMGQKGFSSIKMTKPKEIIFDGLLRKM